MKSNSLYFSYKKETNVIVYFLYVLKIFLLCGRSRASWKSWSTERNTWGCAECI